jgi:hypothetical protein
MGAISGGTTERASVKARFERAREAVKGVLGDP